MISSGRANQSPLQVHPITGLTRGTSRHLIDNLMEWENKFESADLEGHQQFLREAELPVCDRSLEATAWENGFVPEATGLPTDQLERIQGSLPPLAYMGSQGLDSQLPRVRTYFVALMRVTALDDNMQVQCLPVFQADQPKWTYRRVPKVSSFQNSQGFHLGAGNIRHSRITCVLRTSPRLPLCQHFTKMTAKHYWSMERFP